MKDFVSSFPFSSGYLYTTEMKAIIVDCTHTEENLEKMKY